MKPIYFRLFKRIITFGLQNTEGYSLYLNLLQLLSSAHWIQPSMADAKNLIFIDTDIRQTGVELMQRGGKSRFFSYDDAFCLY